MTRTRSGWWWRPGADSGQKTKMEREMRVISGVGRSGKRGKPKTVMQTAALISSMVAAVPKTKTKRLRMIW